MELHHLKINKFCRFCKNLLDGSERNKKKQTVSEMVRLHFPGLEFDFETEDPQQFPVNICTACYLKCYRWKTGYDKHRGK